MDHFANEIQIFPSAALEISLTKPKKKNKENQDVNVL